MGRSTKKGPFVDAKLLTRVEKMNATGERTPMPEQTKGANRG